MTIEDSIRLAAQKLLAKGIATPAEISKLTGLSRQIVAHWGREIDWKTARAEQLRKRWDSLTRRRRP